MTSSRAARRPLLQFLFAGSIPIVAASCDAQPIGIDPSEDLTFERVESAPMGVGCTPWPSCARALSTDPASTPGTSSEYSYTEGIILGLDDCPDMQNFLQGVFENGRIFAYDVDDGYFGWLRFEGTDSVTITLNANNFTNLTVGATLRHEYGHTQIDESSMSDNEAEEAADGYITSCDGTPN